MPSFRFDKNKSFKENCDAFLEAIKTDDAEMAAILRDNWNALVPVVQEGERDSKSRAEFNTNVAAILDARVNTDRPKGGA